MKVSTINRKTRSFIHLLITHNFSGLTHAIARNCKIMSNMIYARGYYLWATFEDIRTGGRCTNKTIASKYNSVGAHAMQNSDYRCLAQIFKAVPLRDDDVYVDVGCGEGRTLTYHASRHFRGKEYGVELDPVFAEIAARRTKRYGNVEIVCGNVLEQDKVVREGTAFFLYNPFGREVLAQFLDMIERKHGSGIPGNMPEAGSDDR